MNSIYECDGKPWCGDCYSDDFASQCPECQKPIKGEIKEAFGANFHPECLMSKQRKLKCTVCNKGFTGTEEVIDALDAYFHVNCFKCSTCGKQFNEDNPPGEKKGKFICQSCFDESMMDTEKCCQCNGNIMAKDNWTVALKLKVHDKCFKCAQCNTALAEIPRFVKGGKLYCKDHK